MSTQPENDDGDMAENNIQDEYFEDTPVKEWKIIGALAYYIKQNVGTSAAYTLIEVSLRTMNTRNTAKKRGESLLEELGVRRIITFFTSVVHRYMGYVILFFSLGIESYS